MTFKVPEKFRFTQRGHQMSSTVDNGNNGAFVITFVQRVQSELHRKRWWRVGTREREGA